MLEDPDLAQGLEDDVEEQVFFLSHEDGSLDDYVALYMDGIEECRYQGVDCRKVRDEDGIMWTGTITRPGLPRWKNIWKAESHLIW